MLPSLKKSVVLVLGVVAVLAACGKQEGGPAGAGGGMPPPEVTVITVQAGSSALTRDLSGRITAVRTAEVRARVDGILEKRLFNEGGEVKAGQSLFKIDARVLEANAATAKAALAKAKSSVLIAKQTADRYRQLVGEQGVSRQEFDQAEAQLKQAEAEVAAAEAEVRRSSVDLEYASVQAPISGRIGRALVSEGALLNKGTGTPLATIEQLDSVYVDFNQSGADLLRLKQLTKAGKLKQASLPVDLLLEDGSSYAHTGKLLFAEQTIDPTTGTVTMRAEFPNPDHLLLPGMFATVRVAQGAMDATVRVPQQAIVSSPQGQFVYVVGSDNKVAPAPVKTGGFSGKDWIVLSGLKGGERVMIDGIQKVRPGAVVNPVDAAAPASAPAKK
ncbi:efflux RND transporter periplasmic adaptor subunit [Iodobacter arcticus]|uniref:Efflux RND transporter periplasmic adaptor subunit n=1 Tax=Iodobacter arcticus TaxID=590593 RepID=A0ABW2R1N5_9NEIS